MSEERVLKICDITDDSGHIRPKILVQADTGCTPHGRYWGADEQGRKRMLISYDHGIVDGFYQDFWTNGKVATEGQYQVGKQEGFWHYYNDDETVFEIVQYKDGKEVIDWDQFFSRTAEKETKT